MQNAVRYILISFFFLLFSNTSNNISAQEWLKGVDPKITAAYHNDYAALYFSEGNYSQSLHYSKLAAEKGNKEAQNRLGFLYLEGLGTEQDYEQAIYWFKIATEQDEPEAKKLLLTLD